MSDKQPHVIGVQGVDSYGAMGEKPGAPQSINWSRLFTLPPFMMFMSEMYDKTGNDALYIAKRKAEQEGNVFFAIYANWHKAKGYWINETPMGELITGVDDAT
ncbi:hypothetical protein ACF3N0_08725 [Moraxella atlantae]|uniref:hypothetical protein n=1 Tax=Faucicola atlantae TaxID=34059 RepID=UPI003753945B